MTIITPLNIFSHIGHFFSDCALYLTRFFYMLISTICPGDKLDNKIIYYYEWNSIMGEYPAKKKEPAEYVYIPQFIDAYEYDRNFIIARQKPIERAFDKDGFNYYLGRDTTYYWLVVKYERLTYGPIDYDSMQKLRKQYNVPDNLKHKEIIINKKSYWPQEQEQ